MNNDTPADAITVIKADRDAVSRYCVEVYGKNVEGRMVRDIQNGKADDHPLVQFAARHRTTSLAAQDGLVSHSKVMRAFEEACNALGADCCIGTKLHIKAALSALVERPEGQPMSTRLHPDNPFGNGGWE